MQQPHRPGSTAALVAAATQVWLDTCREASGQVCNAAPTLVTGRGSVQAHMAGAGAYHAAAGAVTATMGSIAAPVRARRVSGSCVPPVGAQHGSSSGQWARALWGSGHTVAH